MTDESEGGLEMVSGRGAVRVQVSGATPDMLVKLLEDTARFLRNQASSILDEDDTMELMFKRVDIGDFVIFSLRK